MPSRIYLRQNGMTYSRRFIDTVRGAGLIMTRRDRFIRNGILINHGNTNPISLGRKVNRFYIINNPEYINRCSNKLRNYNLLKDYYPKTVTNYKNVKEFPIVAKPTTGYHGYGIKILNNWKEFTSFLRRTNRDYIYQEYIPIKYEYRFNVFNGEVYQVSRKEKVGNTNSGGYSFSYISLGMNAGISDKFWKFIHNVIRDFESQIGSNLGHYCIDVIKGQDGNYYLCEMNSACGFGEYTLSKLLEKIESHRLSGRLEKFRVR